MACYELLTGPFIGAVVEEGIRILDIPFADLDFDLRNRIREYAEHQVELGRFVKVFVGPTFNQDVYAYANGTSLTWETIMEDYENGWQQMETQDPRTLGPASQWDGLGPK